MKTIKSLMMLILFISIFAINCLFANEIKYDFSVPESTLYDNVTNNIYVSNINGSPLDKDNNGFISKLDQDGKLIDLKFIEAGKNNVTLNAPKGLTILDGILFVADIDYIRGFSLKNGEVLYNIYIEGSSFLNDICSVNKDLYITDTNTNKIYKITDFKDISIFVENSEYISGTNGIVYLPEREKFYVVCFGNSNLLEIDLNGNVKKYLDLKIGQNDGIDYDNNGNLYFSSWEGQAVYRIDKNKNMDVFASELLSPADISIDIKNNRLLVPHFQKNSINIIQLN